MNPKSTRKRIARKNNSKTSKKKKKINTRVEGYISDDNGEMQKIFGEIVKCVDREEKVNG